MGEDYYRKIFVVEPSHDLSALKTYTDNIELLTTGYEKTEDLVSKIENNLKDFNPETDAIIPIGKLVSSMLVGMILCKLIQDTPIKIGIYRNKDYEFISVGIPNAT